MRHQRRMGIRFLTLLAGTAVAASVLAPAIAVAASPADQPRTIVDFENMGDVTLDRAQAEAEVVPAADGKALEITTDEAASWPGVYIKPRQGKWDLTGYDAVAMDVGNPGEASVRVLLSINNPGADGQRHCNTASVAVPPRGKAVLTVPFGTWHGETNRPIDLANVVSLQVFLDRPGRGHRFLVDNIRAVGIKRVRLEDLVDAPFFKQMKPVFGRGVNLGNALDAPSEGEWGVVLKEEYFDLIRSAGFDSVRIPARWSAHAEKTAPYRIDPKFLERVDWVIRQALDRRLAPIVNMHHYEEIFKDPEEHYERFVALWRQISERYRGYPPALAFELLNEPNSQLTSDKWNRLLAETLEVVRQTNPTRQVVIGPAGWNAIGELKSLELPEEDRNLIVTVHYYSPFQFTHQGASWTGQQAQQWLGTKWLGTEAEREAVAEDLDKALAWAVEHRRPLFLGEFGAYSTADMESRARWTRCVAETAVRRKIGFAYWEFCSGFGVYDADRGQWNEPLKEALLAPVDRE